MTDPKTEGPEFDPANPERPMHEKLDPALRDKPNTSGNHPSGPVTGKGEHLPTETPPGGPD